MLTIKEIERQIQNNYAKIEAENNAAQLERTKAGEYRRHGSTQQAQAHENAAMQHEQRSLQVQGQIDKLMTDQQRLQEQLTALDQQKNDIATDKDAQLQQVDTQIDKIRGGA